MAVKVIMTWDVVGGRDQEYFEFMIREFLPGAQKLGFELSDAWATYYGDQPQILVAAVVPTRRSAEHIMSSAEWGSLNNRLMDFVTNYTFKIVPARGGFQF
jgi:hypothetical protein